MQGKVTEQIAQRYAEALKELALSQEGLLEDFGRGTQVVLDVLATTPELASFLATPVISMAAKKQLLVTAFGDKVHSYLLGFLQLLVDRRRIVSLEPICKQYQILLRKQQETTLAEVVSAVPLSDAQVSALTDRIRQRTGAKQIDLRRQVEPELLGGMIIKIGDEVIDASLRGQLRKLTLQLTS